MATILAVADALTVLGITTATAGQRALVEMLLPLVDAAINDELKYSVVQATYTHFLPDHELFHTSADYIDVQNNRINVYGWSDTQILQLPEIPVRSLTNVWADFSALAGQGPNDFAESTKLVSGTDYYLDVDASGISWTGHLVRWINTWPARRRSVKVEYVAGFTANELDGKTKVGKKNPVQIKHAALIALVQSYQQFKAWQQNQITGAMGPIESEKLGDYSVSYATEAIAMALGMRVSLPPAAVMMLQGFKRMSR